MPRFLLALLLLLPLQARAAGLTVFAAASMTDAMKDIGTLWQAKGHAPPTFSFAAASTLAQQILHGAPADIFVSADEAWMDKVASRHRIDEKSRFDLAGNTLVVVVRGPAKVDLRTPGPLLALLGQDGRLATGDPAHVPVGLYAAQALKKLGLWDAVKGRLAPTDNVRSALLLVAHGEAPAGIVYGTDVRAAAGLAVAATFPADSHDPIRYPVAATAHARSDAAAFIVFLHTSDVRDVLDHYGFPPP